MANVLNYGADPTGVANSTAAFQAAIAATPVSGTVCIPVSGANGSYKLTPDVIDMAGRHFSGDLENVTVKSRLFPSGAGTAVIFGTDECAADHLQCDAAGLCQYGMRLVNASRSYLFGISCINALAWGFDVEGGESLYCENVNVGSSLNGIRVIGADNSEFYACLGNNNTNTGIYVAGLRSGLTAQEGSVKFFGGQADANVNGPQIVLDGVNGVLISGMYVESGPASIGKQIQFVNGANNCVLEQVRFVLGDTVNDFAIGVISGSGNTFVGCSAPGNNGKRIFIDGAGLGPKNEAFGCFRTSAIITEYMQLYFDNGAGTVWTAVQAQCGLQSTTAPTTGTWNAGDVVWNTAPGAPTGWRCTVAGNPGTWVAF